jgi:hypothetical protein
MKVFVFDLLAYGEQLDPLKDGSELAYPLSNRHFKPEVAVRTYAEHLEAWEEMDKLGFDGVGFNEHHCSPYDEFAEPDGRRRSATTKRLKLLIYGNLCRCTSRCGSRTSWRCWIALPTDG